MILKTMTLNNPSIAGRLRRTAPGRTTKLSAVLLLCPALASAHSPVFDCFNEKDGQVTCEGGFSDGSSAAGVAVKIVDASDKLLLSGAIDKEGRFSFKRPTGDFRVVFDAGKGHSITLLSSDIAD
jgi:hypothetical protein